DLAIAVDECGGAYRRALVVDLAAAFVAVEDEQGIQILGQQDDGARVQVLCGADRVECPVTAHLAYRQHDVRRIRRGQVRLQGRVDTTVTVGFQVDVIVGPRNGASRRRQHDLFSLPEGRRLAIQMDGEVRAPRQVVAPHHA